jgi:hypothetical protein
MPNVLIGQYRTRQVAHDLMHIDQNTTSILRVKGNWLHMRADFAPLLRPVGADFFRPTDKTAFERSGPLHVGSHESKGGVDVSRVEGRVGGAEQFISVAGWFGIRGDGFKRGEVCDEQSAVSELVLFCLFVSMSQEQFAAVAPTKIAEREADRAALYERTAERLSAQLEAYPALSPDHEYLQAKRIKLEPSVYQTRGGNRSLGA